MSKSRAIKAAIAADLAAVAGLSATTIHPRSRATTGEDDSRFRALHVVGDRVNTWEIEREGWSASWRATNNTAEILDSYVIRCWYGMSDDDDSEDDFSELLEDVAAVLLADHHLGATVHTCSPASARLVGHAMKGPYLCHYAELTLTARWFLKKP